MWRESRCVGACEAQASEDFERERISTSEEICQTRECARGSEGVWGTGLGAARTSEGGRGRGMRGREDERDGETEVDVVGHGQAHPLFAIQIAHIRQLRYIPLCALISLSMLLLCFHLDPLLEPVLEAEARTLVQAADRRGLVSALSLSLSPERERENTHVAALPGSSGSFLRQSVIRMNATFFCCTLKEHRQSV